MYTSTNPLGIEQIHSKSYIEQDNLINNRVDRITKISPRREYKNAKEANIVKQLGLKFK